MTLAQLDEIFRTADPDALDRIVRKILAGLESQLSDVPTFEDLARFYLEV